MTRCTCPDRGPGERHLEACPRRGARSGPGGKTSATRAYRLPVAVGDRVTELVRAGKSDVVLEALKGV